MASPFPAAPIWSIRRNRRQPGKVYFFRNQDSRCSVWVGDQAKLMPHYIGG
ncbi:hypothetical protein [Azospirillum sp. INR13]|uniref:hypothetical protein n=1 Tax=Azospirillum sp. INR13 TaxID=2596919 RepID=UPI002102A6B8|nr:hypothetical protein [Azospirillum sp. INR13]